MTCGYGNLCMAACRPSRQILEANRDPLFQQVAVRFKVFGSLLFLPVLIAPGSGTSFRRALIKSFNETSPLLVGTVMDYRVSYDAIWSSLS